MYNLISNEIDVAKDSTLKFNTR